MPEFYKRGVKAVKMDEISQGLHVSKRTVYEIFGDKEELLLAGMMRQLEENRSKLENFAKTQAKNVIDIISYVYKLQMERNGLAVSHDKAKETKHYDHRTQTERT